MNGVIICDLKGCFKHRYGIIFLSFQHLQERAVKELAEAKTRSQGIAAESAGGAHRAGQVQVTISEG